MNPPPCAAVRRVARLAALLLLFFASAYAQAQQAQLLPQVPLGRWGVGAANFSGITPLDTLGHYAVVSDKEPEDGFFLLSVGQDPHTGQITSVRLEGFRQAPHGLAARQSDRLARDAEGIALLPERGTLFISAENDQRILEYDLQAQPTGRELCVPQSMGPDRIQSNYGFEALCHSPRSGRFYTITENSLRADLPEVQTDPAAPVLLRLQAFDHHTLRPLAQYAYRTDRPSHGAGRGRVYVHGVSALCALPDGRLLVLEREANVTQRYLGSEVQCKLFLVAPETSHQIDSATPLLTLDPNRFMLKELLAAWRTRLTATSLAFANYEGLCLGRRLADGRQTLLLIADSQGAAGRGPIHLRDYMRVVVL